MIYNGRDAQVCRLMSEGGNGDRHFPLSTLFSHKPTPKDITVQLLCPSVSRFN